MIDHPPAFLLFAVFLAACFAAGSTGGLFKPGAWYESLKKPVWTPPNWLFPVAWVTLYVCMSLSATRIAQTPSATAGLALGLWAVQIALNTLWTPVFFGLKRMGAGLAVLACLWGSVLLTLLVFWHLDTVAGALLLPYIVWVSVAGALNFSVWRLNPQG